MHLAQEYGDYECQSHTSFTRHVLEKYLPLIQWKEDGAVIMDIGCGTGEVTVEMLLPLLPNNYKQYVGSDRSEEMIQACKKKYTKARVDYMVLDIEADEHSPEMKEKFDHIFSFFCLHWIVDQRKGFANINNLLKCGGNMLVSFIVDSPNHQAFETVYNNEKWRKHMINYEKYANPYMHLDDPEKEFRDVLESTGFNINVCLTITWDFVYKDKQHLKRLLWAISPWVDHMSEHLRDDFMDAIVDAVACKIKWKDGDGALVVPIKFFVAVAEKRKNLI